VWQYAGTIVIWTLGEMMHASFIFAIATDIAPAAMRGRYMGVFGTSYSLAMMLGVPLGGEILSRYGGGYLWAGCLVLGLLSAAMYFRIRQHMRPRSA
jgi:predicted MFS family arabinose efflux permease